MPGNKGRKSYDHASKESRREAKFAMHMHVQNGAGAPTVFNNDERRLKKAPKGTHYIETDVGAGPIDRGRRRTVSLVESSTGRVLSQHQTEDHYASFKKVK